MRQLMLPMGAVMLFAVLDGLVVDLAAMLLVVLMYFVSVMCHLRVIPVAFRT